MKNDLFVVAYEYPPTTNGEGVVCSKLFYNLNMRFIVCRFIREDKKQKNVYPDNMEVFSEQLSDFKWIKWVVKTYFKKSNAKIMHTRTMPEHGHIAGFLIKLLKPSIKWVMYFSDPLWESPYFTDAYEEYTFKRKVYLFFHVQHYRFHKISEYISKLSLFVCDKIVFNNIYLAKHVLKNKFNKFQHKIEIVPYGIDYEFIKDIIPIRLSNSDRILISHVGGIYGKRNFKIVIEALKIVKKLNIKSYNKIAIRHIGNISNSLKKEIQESEIGNCFEFSPNTDYYTSIQYMMGSDFLLCIDAFLENIEYNIYVPSKIYDYLGARKPIIAITQKKGPTADIIRETNNILVDHNSELLAEILIKITENELPSPLYEKYNEFGCKKGSDKFKKIIEELLSK